MKLKKINLFLSLLLFFLSIGSVLAQSNDDLVKLTTINNLAANGTQAKRYEIAKIGYNSFHWQEGGLIEIELRQKTFGTNYEKYVIELGYGQGTGTTSPSLRSIESTGSYRNAKVTLGESMAMGTSYANEPNMILPIYVDVKYYTNYIAQIRYLRTRVETLNSYAQIYINENPLGVNIPDFSIDKGAEAVFISKEGNFGLWNQSPSRKLHVGSALTGQSSDQEADIVSSSGIIIGNGKMLSFDQNYHTHASIKYSTVVANESRMVFQGYYGHAFTTRGDIPRMVINGENGNVGIGTTSPQQKLDISGNLRISGGLTRPDNAGLALQLGNGTNNHFGNTAFYDIVGTNQRMLITETGNVGIGTSTPKAKLEVNGNVAIGFEGNLNLPSNYKLAVDGNIIAEKIKIKNSNVWPDFVFEPHYKLPNLMQLESFVKQNKHLPEIPSAKEIEKDGHDLGEMNRLLLKKIEELTLYMIEMKKENDSLKSRIEKLEN